MKSLFIGLAAGLLCACSGAQVLNSITVARKVEIATNAVYDDVIDGRLDIYRPEGARGAPVIVFFHGGRWSKGSKEEYEFVGKALAARGYVVAIPDLRKYPQVRFPAFVEDAAQSVKWTRETIGRYGGNPDQLFLVGHSSGAHIAAMLALDEQFLKAVGGSREWLKGMIGLAGPYDFMPITAPDLRDMFGPPEDFEKSQPIYFTDGRNPPLLLVHGEDDETVGVKNTRSLARAVKAAGGPVETVLYLELSHEMAVGVLAPLLQENADVMEGIVDFIGRHRSGKSQAQAVTGEAFVEPEPAPEGEQLPAPIPQPLPDPSATESAPQSVEQPASPPPAADDGRAPIFIDPAAPAP